MYYYGTTGRGLQAESGIYLGLIILKSLQNYFLAIRQGQKYNIT